MRSLVAAMLCAWALTGCGLVMSWSKPGGSADAFNRDRYACLRESNYMHQDSFGNVYSMTDYVLYNACMATQGWERKVGGGF